MQHSQACGRHSQFRTSDSAATAGELCGCACRQGHSLQRRRSDPRPDKKAAKGIQIGIQSSPMQHLQLLACVAASAQDKLQ